MMEYKRLLVQQGRGRGIAITTLLLVAWFLSLISLLSSFYGWQPLRHLQQSRVQSFASTPKSLAREQFSHLLKQLGSAPDLGDFDERDAHKYTDYPPASICFFTADDRPLHTPEEMDMENPSWIRDNTPEDQWAPKYGFSVAFWLTKLWTVRHGHRLFALNGTHMENRGKYWNKHTAMRQMVNDPTCSYAIYLDTDIYLRAQHYSFMDMRKRWKLDDSQLLAAAVDPGVSDHNAGFVIFKNDPRTSELLEDWIACPDRYEDCKSLSHGSPGDQGALDQFIIPKAREMGAFTSLSCNEATGGTYVKDFGSHCEGSILTHNWYYGRKMLAQEAVSLSAFYMMDLVEKLDTLEPLYR